MKQAFLVIFALTIGVVLLAGSTYAQTELN
jgi:hypothetical protein